MELADLPNVGKVLASNLRAVGIETAEALRETGAEEAFLRIRVIDPGACLHMLYGLQGAVDGVRDNLLPEDKKRALKAFFKTLS